MSDIKITKGQVEYLASLAQLELTRQEMEKFASQLTSILQYVNRIKDVELSDDVQRNFNNVNTFRNDDNPHKAGEHRDAILEAMPETKDNLLVVKKILNN